ncbi:MAG: CoA transferase [Dehalococcoidia bacterium]|nr:CoA transferase [Dehalococcoidia bacterium]
MELGLDQVDTRAFAGIRVVDFTWAVAGPMTTRYLGDHGAEVIKVESITKIDPLRTGTPFRNNKPTVNGSAYFTNANRGKYSLGLNLRNPRGIELAKRVIATADVVAENYTPGVMQKWGLGYEDVRKIKPDIIMFSTSQQGQTGPLSQHPALGNSLVSLAGLTHITGWPDRPPVGPYGAYPDYTAPPLGAALIAAALAYRRRTGKGQHVDLSQYEVNLHLVAPVLLGYSANGRTEGRDGNRCERAVPHGVYRCLGEDRWCAISVFSGEEWKAFCSVLGNPDWTLDARFAALSQRKQNEDELDRRVEEWTVVRSAEEVMTLMQASGVPAGVAQSTEDLHNDVHLKHRHYLRMLDHPEIGIHAHDAPPFQLSQTPANLDRPAPLLGEHNEYVCHELLGMPDEEFVELLAAGVLEQV